MTLEEFWIHVMLLVIGGIAPQLLIGETWPLLIGIPSVLLAFSVAVLHHLSSVRVMFSRTSAGGLTPFSSRSVPRLVRYGAVLAGLEAVGSMLWMFVAYGEGGPRETPGGAAWVRDDVVVGTMTTGEYGFFQVLTLTTFTAAFVATNLGTAWMSQALSDQRRLMRTAKRS